MDYSNVYKIFETLDYDEANAMIKEHDWIIIGVAHGENAERLPIFKYSLGDIRARAPKWAPDPEITGYPEYQ